MYTKYKNSLMYLKKNPIKIKTAQAHGVFFIIYDLKNPTNSLDVVNRSENSHVAFEFKL
jgi:hypothetical protein